jgi:hypothetical protein
MDINLDIIRNLLVYNKTYKDIEQIEEEIVNSAKKKSSAEFKSKPGTLVGCKILYGPDILKRRMGMKLIT